jgi:hypothetical protein
MISSCCQTSSHQRQALVLMIFRGIGICISGLLLGLAVFNMESLPTQMLIAISAGLLLLIFPIAPEGFLLIYLISLPFLDALIPFFTVEQSGLRFGPQILFRGGLTVLLAYYWLINQRNPLAFKPAIPMLLLVLLLVLSTLASGIRIQVGFITLAKHVYWMLLLLTVADMVAQGRMKLKTIYRCVIISTLCFMAVVVTAPFLGIDLGSFYDIDDVRGPYTPHGLALGLCQGFIVALALCSTQKSRFFLLFLILFCVATAISIARTYVRTGYLSFFASLSIFTLFVWLYGKRQTILLRYRTLLSLVFIIIIGSLCVYGLTHAEDFKKRNRDLSSFETAGSGRTIIYRKALEKYSDSSIYQQLLGSGLGDMYFLLGTELKVPHNDYLVFLLAGGLAGLALHIWILASLWRQIKLTARINYLPLIIANSAMGMFVVATMTNPVVGYMSVMTFFSFLVGGAMGYYAGVGANPGAAMKIEGTKVEGLQFDRSYTKS